MKKSISSIPKKKISKKIIEEEILNFFNPESITNKNAVDIKKIKKKAMSKNVHLKGFKKSFCRYCLMPYSGKEEIRIRGDMKIIRCQNCGKINRWKIK